MKILKSQSAVLTNFEVSRFIDLEREKCKTENRRQPAATDALAKEVQSYLRTFPNPLHEAPHVGYSPHNTYSDESIRDLVYRLSPYKITKAEMIMVFNMRPENMAVLLAIIEDADDRWTALQQREILEIIKSVLGNFPDELRENCDGGRWKGDDEMVDVQPV